MSNRINPASTSTTRAAIILVDRLGTYAYREASNRADRAVNLRTDTQAFYEQVMDEVSKLLDANPDRRVPLRVREARARRDRLAQGRDRTAARRHQDEKRTEKAAARRKADEAWNAMDQAERRRFLAWISSTSNFDQWPLLQSIRSQLVINAAGGR
jgi:hypothetical protein